MVKQAKSVSASTYLGNLQPSIDRTLKALVIGWILSCLVRILSNASASSWSGQARHHGILVQQLLQNQAVSWGGRHSPSSCFLHCPWTRLGARSHCKAAATMVSICSLCHQELLFLPDRMHSKRKRMCLPFLPSFSSFTGHF